ncbi:unnamed protein product [Gordionus sp. m RMFG-2023]
MRGIDATGFSGKNLLLNISKVNFRFIYRQYSLLSWIKSNQHLRIRFQNGKIMYLSTFPCYTKFSVKVLSYIFFKANTIGPSGAFIGMAAYNQTAHVQIPLREAKTYQDFFVRGLPYYTTTDIN